MTTAALARAGFDVIFPVDGLAVGEHVLTVRASGSGRTAYCEGASVAFRV